MRFSTTKFASCLAALASVGVACPQGSLSLDAALKLAKERNGTVRAAYLNVKAASSRVREAFGAFLPTVTPSYRYTTSRTETFTGLNKGLLEGDANSTKVVANWQLLDSGERSWALGASRAGEDAERLGYLQTLRETLFSVHQQYLETLRAQELLKVAEGQVKRAQEILQQTKDFAEQGQGARLAISQANADYQNARVQVMVARNGVSGSEANLKALIGWDKDEPLPALVKNDGPKTFSKLDPLSRVLREGLEARADLAAQRKRVAAQRYDVLRADRNSLFSWSLDASYTRSFSEDVSDDSALSFQVSLPLFDGERSRQAARQARLGWESSKASFLQAERAARADIEASYRDLEQNAERVAAAQAALDSANENFKATNESFTLGASTLIDVLTAQVTLQTAESNHIQAIYDSMISEIRLRLATGKELPGEAG